MDIIFSVIAISSAALALVSYDKKSTNDYNLNKGSYSTNKWPLEFIKSTVHPTEMTLMKSTSDTTNAIIQKNIDGKNITNIIQQKTWKD